MSVEKPRSAISGYPMLFLGIILIALAIFSLVQGIRLETPLVLIPLFTCLILGLLAIIGLFIVNPNEAIALLLFGSYKGTCRDNGFRWANPFLSKL